MKHDNFTHFQGDKGRAIYQQYIAPMDNSGNSRRVFVRYNITTGDTENVELCSCGFSSIDSYCRKRLGEYYSQYAVRLPDIHITLADYREWKDYVKHNPTK